MPLHIDRVDAQMQILRRPDGTTAQPSDATSGESLDRRDALVRQLRPVVLEILREHLRELERRGVL